MILNKRTIYAVLIIWVLIFGLLIRFGLLPLFEDVEENSRELAFQKEALQFLEFRIEDFEHFKENYSYYQSVLEKIDNSFVNQEVPIEFIEFLEKEAEKSGLSIGISPLIVARGGGDLGSPVGFQISLMGNFPDCLRFLERLEQSSFFVEISQLNISKASVKKTMKTELETVETGDVSFILKIKAFSKEGTS